MARLEIDSKQEYIKLGKYPLNARKGGELSIKVYPKQIVYCPKTSNEKNANDCISCDYLDKSACNLYNRLFISCNYDKATSQD